MIKNDPKILSQYINILAQSDLESASKIVKDLDVPAPSDLFPQADQEGWGEDDCLRQLIDAAMPEKTKEKKTTNVQMKVAGGAEIFIPKKRANKRIRYPKDYDPLKQPDPERWLPKWQRSRFKKMAKKKGIYLKGAQGDAQIDTDVTSGNLKSTAHKEAATGGNKRRKK
jgi:signal recognition particle subunit SRP72